MHPAGAVRSIADDCAAVGFPRTLAIETPADFVELAANRLACGEEEERELFEQDNAIF